MTIVDRAELDPGDIVHVRYMTGDVTKDLVGHVDRFSPAEEPSDRSGFWTPRNVWVGLPVDATIARL